MTIARRTAARARVADITLPNLPSSVQVEFTSHCNLHCKMCPLQTGGTISGCQPRHLSDELWEKILPMATEIGSVIIAGYGEPLMHPRCFDFLKQLNDLGVHSSISTNATLMTPQNAAKIASLGKVSHINVSIDSPDAGIYENIRGKPLAEAMQGLQNLMAVIDDPLRITVSSVVLESNLESLVYFPHTLGKLGVPKFILQGFASRSKWLNRKGPLNVSGNGSSGLLDLISKACQRADVELVETPRDRLRWELEDPERARRVFFSQTGSDGNSTKQCGSPWETLTIDSYGKVFPCCAATGDASAELGDLNESDLYAIWQNAKYQQFRRSLLEGPPPEVCSYCTVCSWGEHPLKSHSAEIVYGESKLVTHDEGWLVVRNTGTSTWTHEDHLRIGRIRPKDRRSIYRHPSWLGPVRVSSFSEDVVRPGELATFRFQLAEVANNRPEVFQLVMEGKLWLPNTEFTLCGARKPMLRGLRKHRPFSWLAW